MKNVLIMYSTQPPSNGHIERLSALRPDVSVAAADSEESAIRHAADAEIILGHRYLRQVLPHTRRLKWVQSTAAGPEHLLSPELIRINPAVTRCPVFSDVIAVHAFALALSLLRRIPDAVKSQAQNTPSPCDFPPLPRTAMIFGMGCIGTELARLLRANGISVIGVVRTSSLAAREVCDEVLTSPGWQKQLHRADLCFITLPLTRETTGLFDERVLRKLPPHAILVNAGRRKIVDTEALIRVLNAGHLAGAAFDETGIPPSDPLRSAPRLLITPKTSTFVPGRQPRLELFIEDQVRRYLNGETLHYPFPLHPENLEVCT